MDYLDSQKVDLLISDIEMPFLTGLESLQQLNSKPMTIFVTADPSKAFTAYELDAIDCLVKAFAVERFNKLLQKP